MRAARVLDMLLHLQRRGRTTAAELAERLEVSERTILRDVQALGEAGVPIFTIRGAEGGVELMDGFETRLTGLTEDEAAAVFLAGTPGIARSLGLGRPARRAQRKLVEALSPGLRDRAEHLFEWFLHDPSSRHTVPPGELGRLADCIERRRVIEVTVGGDEPVAVRPLGIVLKAGSWFLVISTEAGPTVMAIDDLGTTRITRHEFERPPDFDLTAFWADHVPRGARDR